MRQIKLHLLQEVTGGLVVGTATAFTKVGEPVSLVELEAAYMALPDSRRTMGDLMRSVRPRVVADLEARRS